MQIDNNFEVVAKKWFDTKKTLWKEKHAISVWRSLERCIFPYIGKVNINDIDTPLVLTAIQKIEKNGATDTAHRVRQRVESIFNYAVSVGMVTHNPATVIKGALKPTVKNKHPAITDIDGLREVLIKTDNTPAHPLTKLALRLLALTVVRSKELRGMMWGEVDGDIWTIPAERMKKLSDIQTLNDVELKRKVQIMETISKNYRDVILQCIFNEYGRLRSGSKILARKINISPRSVENWFRKRNAPNGEQLIELMIENDVIADSILQLIEERKQKRRREHAMD